MGLFLANGTRVTKANVDVSNDPDPIVVLNTDLYLKSPYSKTDPVPGGGKRTIFARAGKKFRRSEIDLLFPAPTVSSITPATGVAAGNTLVTVRGQNLDGVTGVTFGGTAATSVTVVNETTLTCRTPAKSAGAYTVVVTDDGGTATVTNGFTYTA